MATPVLVALTPDLLTAAANHLLVTFRARARQFEADGVDPDELADDLAAALRAAAVATGQAPVEDELPL